MSEDQLKTFIARVANDSELRRRLIAENADPVAIAKAIGFSIKTTTHYHFGNWPKPIEDQCDDDSELALSDEDVEGVVGGGAGICRCLSRHYR